MSVEMKLIKLVLLHIVTLFAWVTQNVLCLALTLTAKSVCSMEKDVLNRIL